MGVRRGTYRVLVGKPEGRRPLRRPRRRWEDSIKMDLREVMGGHGLDQSGSRQVHVAGCCECGDEPSGYIKCGEFLEWLTMFLLLRKDSAAWSKSIGIQTAATFVNFFMD
jgi:hypothetical protein